MQFLWAVLLVTLACHAFWRALMSSKEQGRMATKLHFLAQLVLVVVAWSRSEVIPWGMVVAMDAALYLVLISPLAERPGDVRELIHHVIWALALLTFLIREDHDPVSQAMEVAGYLLFVNSRGVLVLLSVPAQFRNYCWLYLGAYRLFYYPYVISQTWDVWTEPWHIGMHAFSCVFAVAELILQVYPLTQHVIHGTPRDLVFRLVGLLQGKKVVVLTTQDMQAGKVYKVLKTSAEKGTFLEHFHSLQAWAPLVSVESVDGVTYDRLIKGTHLVLRQVKMLQRAAGIADGVVLQERLRTAAAAAEEQEQEQEEQEQVMSKLIDGLDMQRVIATVYHRLLFGAITEPKQPTTTTIPMPGSLQERADVQLWCDAAQSFSAVIAAKKSRTQTHHILGTRVLQRAEALGQNMPWYPALQKLVPDPVERVSCFLQPLLLSPIINSVDALVALGLTAEGLRDEPAWQRLSPLSKQEFALARYPAFPILERWVEKEQTQYVINTDAYAATVTLENSIRDVERKGSPQTTSLNKPASWLAFGAGSRMCAGKSIALRVLEVLYSSWLQPALEAKPGCVQWDNSETMFSGRHNDDKQHTSLYNQVTAIGQVLYRVLHARVFDQSNRSKKKKK